MMFDNDDETLHKEHLLKLLKKLNLKSAGIVYDALSLQFSLDKILREFGKPDQMLLDPHTFKSLSSALKPKPKLGKKKK